ncbi:MAG: Phosphoenolpyruvate synthase [Chlamydiae bacterium]|nr:Phosphoenolpyruvate synthase [Chlamydiota bacterium]
MIGGELVIEEKTHLSKGVGLAIGDMLLEVLGAVERSSAWPSDYPDFAAFLVEAGIDPISLNPDSVIGVLRKLSN